jgi:hypothetical protein
MLIPHNVIFSSERIAKGDLCLKLPLKDESAAH